MGATEYPMENVPLDPAHDPIPVTHWFQEIGPHLLDAIQAMLGFATGVV
ncbi:hypothetical protein [Corynebacterium pseudopelargi]|uniref:Uncharacterized protein n=1 Tax=Corynebacterium pseudopelargi TaxID=2080757 RepID=A0A3G6IX17_9CORY|nr:hypothetical protein [Corynebacterium pseudopelargi]AZA10207.1 hypothetical protein CPPEL_10550 [Corynebacterium pseudopelargi]